MILKRFLILLAFMVVVSGCKAPQIISAKTAMVEPTQTFPLGDMGILHETTDLNGRGSAEAQQLRERAFAFEAEKQKDLSLYEKPDGSFNITLVAVSQYRTDSIFPHPTQMEITTQPGQVKGRVTHNGRADIRFGTDEPVFTTATSGGYFELTVSDIFERDGDKMASGTFSFNARNGTNPLDGKRLFVMDGAFIARVNN